MKRIPLYILCKRSKNHIQYEGRRTYSFNVAGGVSLALLPRRMRRLPDSALVLSFEYRCGDPIWMAEATVARKHRVEYRGIEKTDKWKEATIDISEHSVALRDLLYIAQDSLLLSFVGLPVSAPVAFSIRKICLRERSLEEERVAKKKELFGMRKGKGYFRLEALSKVSFPCRLTGVRALESSLEITGEVPIGHRGCFCLGELRPWANLSPREVIKVAPIAAEEDSGAFTLSVPRFGFEGEMAYDRLYSKFIVLYEDGGEFAFASAGRHVESVRSSWAISPLTPKNKKGLGDFRKGLFDSDLEDLGISFITVNIRITDFFCLNPGEGRSAYQYGGKTYYIDDACVGRYDAAIKEAALHGIIVSAILLVRPLRQSLDPSAGFLFQHPDYEGAGLYSMPDLTSPESVNAYLAALNFLTERYTRPDGLHGHVHRWIVHNEVDAGWIWCNAGQRTLGEFVEVYLKSLRLVWLAARSRDGNAGVYVPLTHNWNTAPFPHTFPGASFLNTLQEYCAAEGDFNWGVAFHPYPQQLWEPRSWLDDKASNDDNTPLITFKNIEVLDGWARSSRNRFNGSVRSLMLSEQNPNSPDYSEKSQRLQAASLAYVWRKIRNLDSIEAYIAHCWIDDPSEGGLRTGLRKSPEDPSDPGGKKLSWSVFRDLDSTRESKAFSLADRMIQIDIGDEDC